MIIKIRNMSFKSSSFYTKRVRLRLRPPLVLLQLLRVSLIRTVAAAGASAISY